MISTVDHKLFSLVVAAPGLDGGRLFVAVALANWAVIVTPALIAWLWLTGTVEDRAATVATTLAAGVALASAMVLSSLIDLPRPFADGAAVNYLHHVQDSSFPSDHAALLFALAFGSWIHRPPCWPLLWLPSLALALAVGWARVYLGAHYPIDIAGGALVGAVAAIATTSPPGRFVAATTTNTIEKVRACLAAGARHVLSRGGQD